MHSLEFFRDEIRNGFYIPTAIKVSWAATLDVLAEIDIICRKHNITYFADWGTILGAVRHGGIVPWDDDIDICMKRDDYNKFRSIADSELPKHFAIHNYERQENHWLFLSRVVNNTRIQFDAEYLNSHYNHPWLTGIDIFVKDYLYRDTKEEEKRCEEILLILAIADGIITNQLNGDNLSKNLEKISLRYNLNLTLYASKRDLAISLYKLAEQQMARVPESESDMLCQIFPWGLKGLRGEPKEYYEETELLPFEDTYIPVPICYNNVLTNRYGNYFEIHKVWNGHEYPAFNNQQKLFEKTTGAVLHKYFFETSATKRPLVENQSSLKVIANEALSEIKKLFSQAKELVQFTPKKSDNFAEIFGSIQQLATELGTLIEATKGKSSPTTRSVIPVLENLCEQVYISNQNITENNNFSSLTCIDRILDNLSVELDKNLFCRKEVLFLPVGPIEWNALDAIYKEISQDPDIDIFVVPLPLMMKDCYGNITCTQNEINAIIGKENYPKYLNLTDYNIFDLALHCPDRIYIQNPYDAENTCLTVPPQFYSKNLILYTPDLIFTPIGKTSEFSTDDITDQTSMDFYVPMPGLVHADRIILQSENIKQNYIEKLTAWAGENTRDYWRSKIDVHPKENGDIVSFQEKKKILFCISSYEYYEHKCCFDVALNQRFTIFNDQIGHVEVSLFIYPPCNKSGISTDFFLEVEKLAKEFALKILPYSKADFNSIVSSFDAYYGSVSPLVPMFIEQKKPVMIANYDV